MHFSPWRSLGWRLPSRRALLTLLTAAVCLSATILLTTSRSVGADDVLTDPAPGDSEGLAPTVLSPVGDIVPLVSVHYVSLTDGLTATTPAPPTACPAPEASFTDTWGAPRSGGRAHKGVDMMAPHGSPALAPVAGVVRSHYSGLGGLSYYLDGEDGNTYFGTHLATMTADGPVQAGQQIGTVGSTGNAGTPHLHFEVMVGGTSSVNPYPFALGFCL